MPRNVDPALMAALTAANVWLAVLGLFRFRSGTEYVWTGPGPLVWQGNTFKGVGSLGRVGDVTDSGTEEARGTTVELSGLDAAWLSDVQTEIRQGAPAKLWLAALTPELGIIGTPYMFFRGGLDKARVEILPPTLDGQGTSRITLNLETRLINHGRPNARRYTSADQNANGYPTDSFFDWVEQLNDLALVEGT